jgi:hypothetical protein
MEHKNRWTKQTAEMAVASLIASNKVVILNGEMSLRQCSAADYLANHCGYIQRVG